MKFDQYLALIRENGNISEVKLLILSTLWGEDKDVLKPKWISSKYLLEITKQKYFDRRARELRDQLGCDIETKFQSDINDHAWILKSVAVSKIVNREYLSEKQKKELFVNSGYRCSTCGVKIDPGVRGLQADHKVPLSRNGTNDIKNWQAMCNNCNVGKRRACENCELNCNECSWAFPEKFGIPLIVPLNKDVLDQLKLYSQEYDRSISDVVAEAATEYMTNNQLKKK